MHIIFSIMWDIRFHPNALGAMGSMRSGDVDMLTEILRQVSSKNDLGSRFRDWTVPTLPKKYLAMIFTVNWSSGKIAPHRPLVFLVADRTARRILVIGVMPAAERKHDRCQYGKTYMRSKQMESYLQLLQNNADYDCLERLAL